MPSSFILHLFIKDDFRIEKNSVVQNATFLGKNFRKWIVCCICFCLLACEDSSSLDATLTGTVTEVGTESKPIANVLVSVTSIGTNESTSVSTNQAGVYSVRESLQAGEDYTIQFAADGYEILVIRETISAGVNRRDVQLTVPTCFDGIQNRGESGVDCGGSCPTSCPIVSCTDNLQNGNEEGTDCGGSCPDACPTCTDGVQNGDELGQDCGGSCNNTCPTFSCTDAIQNGDEEGIDCGGSCPDACPSCTDNRQNGDEEGIDCGGSCPNACPSCADNRQNGDEEGMIVAVVVPMLVLPRRVL